MKKILGFAAAALCLSIGFSGASQANYYSWGGEDTGIALTFPDTWKVAINKGSDDVLRIVAPAGENHVVCEFKMREDNRYRVYPERYQEAAAKISYGQKFWEQYVLKHDNVQMHIVKEAGLGGGYGSYALASYTPGYPEVYEKRASVMFVGFYNGNVNIADCSAPEAAFDTWRPDFLSIIGSVTFRKEYHELITGNYQNFLEREFSRFNFQNLRSGETRQY